MPEKVPNTATTMDNDPHTMTPEEEERLIESEFQDVLNGYLKSNHRKKVEIIERAFRFAKRLIAAYAAAAESRISFIPLP